MIIRQILLAIIFISIPLNAFALDADIENDLQKSLLQSRQILERAEEKIKTGQPIDAEVKALASNLENIKASHLLLRERFTERQRTVKTLGSKAVERQMQMDEGYSRALGEYIHLVESLASEGNAQLIIRQLKTLLDRVLYKKKTPILGSLPYRNLNYPAKEPDTSTSIEPAYRGGDAAVTDDDLKATVHAPLSEEIVYHAQTLQWNPVEIYEWVKNNIETEWYWGCMKGAEETLRQKSGNDCDQASLLIALLRASGFPSRYVRGVIEIESDRLKNLTGINDAAGTAALLQKAGIPFRPVIRGGTIGAFEMEHLWVESEVPYSNYRGAIIDEQGKAWLGLDTTMKVAGYERNDPADIYSEQLALSDQLSAIRNNYLAAVQTQTPLEYIRNYLDTELGTLNTGLTYNDLLATDNLIPEVLKILPASMQYEQKAITGEYTDVPDELTHRARFIASDMNNSELFSHELGTALLSNQKISISYEPETVEDQEIINSYGGLDNTPSYLVKLRPVLMLNGKRLVVALDGLPMGADYKLAIELITPNGTEKIESVHITGNLSVIGLISQKSTKGTKEHEGEGAEQLLYEEAMNYIDRWNEAEDEFASLMHMTLTRPISSVATVGGVVDVTYLLDLPHGFERKGVYVDASLRSVSPIPAEGEYGSTPAPSERQKTFMQLSALHGSVLEHRIFEDDFGVGSISTAKLFTLNSEQGTQNHVIDQSNIDTVLPSLSYDANIKEDIANAVNQGMVVTIPETESVYEDWTGIGYIKEAPGTGEAGYMLNGEIAGGMTAWGFGRWPETLEELLSNPFSDPPNFDNYMAVYIEKVSATDFQTGEVGEVLPRQLQVKVTDIEGSPVKGAEVVFIVKAGGGRLVSSATEGSSILIAETDFNGIAEAAFRLGKNTADNPTYMKINSGDQNFTQIGENIVEASLNNTGRKTRSPFTAFGKPGTPEKIVKAFPLSHYQVNSANTPVGSIRALVADRYDNPVSNVAMTFSALPAAYIDPDDVLPEGHRNIEFYKYDDCDDPVPFYGDCITYESMTFATEYYGAIVNAIIGNTYYTEYTVQVSAGALEPVYFYFRSYGYFSGKYEQIAFSPPGFYVVKLEPVNADGEFMNVTKVGTQLDAPLASKMFLLYNEDFEWLGPELVGGAMVCQPDGTCEIYDGFLDLYWVHSSGIIHTERITDATVTFDIKEGDGEVGSISVSDDGLYEGYFVAGAMPGENKIEVHGEAEVSIPSFHRYTTILNFASAPYTPPSFTMETVTMKTNESIYFTYPDKEPVTYELDRSSEYYTYTVYSVDIAIDRPPAIMIETSDEENTGYSAGGLIVSYTIRPQQYLGTAAYVALLEDGVVTAVIPSEAKGSGSVTFSEGFRFDLSRQYEVQVVLNPGTANEVKSDAVPLTFIELANISGTQANVERVYHLSQFDGGMGPDFTDSYQTFDFEVEKPSTVSLKILDDSLNEKATLVAETPLEAGSYNFVVDYEMIVNAGFSFFPSPVFYLKLMIEPDDSSSADEIIYPGHVAHRTNGKMLGQTMVHDVLIQDGSLNLSRQDFELKGRGPQLAFSRTYNNQSSAEGHRPLGEGWSHSLDMRLWPLSMAESTSGSIPDWVAGLKGQFYTDDQVPSIPATWTLISVNGTTFRNENGTWHAEKGRHGKLELSGSTYIYTSKDGTRYTYQYPANNRPTPVQTIEDRNGNVMTFGYDSIGRLETVTDATGRQLTFEYFYPNGFAGIYGSRLMNISGPDGIEMSFTYNDYGYLKSAIRGSRVETYEYSQEIGIAGGVYNLSRTTDSNRHSYEYEYYGPGEIDPYMATFVKVLKSQDIIKSVHYPDGSFARFQYDVQTGNKRIVTDLRGNDTVYTLNFFGNPTRIEEPEGKVTLMTWSIDESRPDNVMTSKTDGRNNTTLYEYDGKGNITLEADPYNNSITTVWNQQFSLPESRTDRNGIVQTWQYDANGNLQWHEDGDLKRTNYTYYPTGEVQTMTDPRTYVTNYTYDQWGNPDTVTGPEGSVTDFDYDIRGRRTAVTDPNGNRTEYTYDALDYPDQIIHPAITVYTLPAGSTNIQDFDYDAEGNLIKETNRVGLTLTYDYTARDQVATILRNIGGAKSFTYDENGNLLSETDWKGIPTDYTYDALNRRVSTNNRLADTMYMAYDMSDNLTEVTDYEGRITNYEYDKLNRLTDTWQAAREGEERGNIHNTYYNEADPEKNLETVTDQENNTTTYEYNGRYLRTKQINALTHEYIWDYDDSGNLSKETDEENNYTDYEYDKQNRLTAKVRNGTIRTDYEYDANGNRTHVIDPRGKDTEAQYDEWNRAYNVIDPDNYHTTTEYDGEGNEVKVKDGNNNVRTWEREMRGLVITAVDAEGNPTGYTYDLNGNVKTVTDPRGSVTVTTYDAEDREITITEASGTDDERTMTIHERDKMGNPELITDYRNVYTLITYDARYQPISVCSLNCTKTTYYKTGKVKTVENRRSYITSYEYDALNRETKVTDAKTFTIDTTYDKVGNVKTVTDKRNIVTENFYDGYYRLIRTERAGTRLVTNGYDDAGNLTSVLDANNNLTEHTYNNRNLLDTTTHPDTTTESRTYDGVGNILTHTNEENKVTTYTYDKENRQRTVEFAGDVTENKYDENGNLIEVIKPESNSRAMEYDWLNRLITVIDDPITESNPGGLNLTTSYEYDDNGNLLHQYDARNNHVEFTYDQLNRKTRHIQHKASGNLVTQFTEYDEEGNLKTMIDPMGRTFTYAYDELDRQTDATYPDVASPFNKIVSIHREYDANNNNTSITETKTAPDSSTVTDTTVNNYDNFDRLDDSTQRALTVDYGYDNNGNRTLVSTPAGSTTYTFDSRNRLKTAVVGTEVTVYNYYPDGKKDTINYPNGTYAKYTYHPSNRVDTVANKLTSDGSTFSSYTYVYDQNGNRTFQAELQNGVTETTTYNYDSVDRMTDYTVDNGVNTTLTEYTFEGYNRKTETISLDGTTTKDRTYNYDETDWVTSISDSVDGKTITYTYDNNGNTISKSDSLLPDNDTTFTYDARNQLIETKQGPAGSKTVLGQYDYNADGLRVRHLLSERGDVEYYYDDNAVIEEHNAADDSLLAHYRYADRLLTLYSVLGTQYYHHDGLGSTVNLTTETSSVQVSYKLDPWGHIKSQTGTSVNRQIFTGQEHDENTGLIYFGARYYDPATARFITQDSYLGEQNTPPSLHRYLYAYSNPTVYWDSTGYVVESDLSDYFDSRRTDLNIATSELMREADKMFGTEAKSPWDRVAQSRRLANQMTESISQLGINKETAQYSAVVLVENGKGEEDVRAEVFEYLGEGFRRAYQENDDLRGVFDERFKGAGAGDIINISDFWQRAVKDTGKRGFEWAVNNDIYNNPLALPHLVDVAVSNDELAPPSLREEASLSKWTTRGLIYLPLIVKGISVVRSNMNVADDAFTVSNRSFNKVHIDVGGEGRYPGAINLNPGSVTTTTGTPGRSIPNLVKGLGEQMPFKSKKAQIITLENAPISSDTASEISRVIKSGGEVRLVHPADYAVQAHKNVIKAIGGGKVTQTTANGITTTIIKVP